MEAFTDLLDVLIEGHDDLLRAEQTNHVASNCRDCQVSGAKGASDNRPRDQFI